MTIREFEDPRKAAWDAAKAEQGYSEVPGTVACRTCQNLKRFTELRSTGYGTGNWAVEQSSCRQGGFLVEETAWCRLHLAVDPA